MAMSIFEKLNYKNSQLPPYLNTGCTFDICTGEFNKGIDAKHYLNGGIGPITGCSGKEQTYKSTTLDSLIAGVLTRYPGVEVIKWDTENNTFGTHRFDLMAGEHISDRIVLWNIADVPLNAFNDKLKEIIALREKHRKDLMVETPFFNVEGSGPRMIWLPLIVYIDSWSKMRTANELKLFESLDIDDSKTKMLYMNEGMVKTNLLSIFNNYAAKYGIYFVLTAHVTKEKELNPMEPIRKQLQHQNYKEKLNNVGKDFTFLTNLLFQVMTPTTLLDSKKESEYPLDDNSPAVEINELNARIQRCKTNFSGTNIPLVFSQKTGILPGLSDYHYLKNHDDFGMEGNQVNRRCMLYPDENLTRKNIREKTAKSYELRRALEILTQLKYIHENWNTSGINVPLPKTALELVEGIHKSNSLKMSDILNSRGYWTYNKEDPREYMSIFDIVQLLEKK